MGVLNIAIKSAKLTSKLGGAATKKTLQFFSREFPKQVKQLKPEALAFGGLTARHAIHIGMGVVEKIQRK